jgi:hypothetical protein
MSRMPFAGHAPVFPGQQQDHDCRRQGADLKRDEQWIPLVDGEGADEQTTGEPHPPRTAADSLGAVLSLQVHDLRHVGRRRDRDPGDTKDFKHSAPLRAVLEGVWRSDQAAQSVCYLRGMVHDGLAVAHLLLGLGL